MLTLSLIGGIILTHYSVYVAYANELDWVEEFCRVKSLYIYVYNLGEHKPYLPYDSYGNESLEKKECLCAFDHFGF